MFYNFLTPRPIPDPKASFGWVGRCQRPRRWRDQRLPNLERTAQVGPPTASGPATASHPPTAAGPSTSAFPT